MRRLILALILTAAGLSALTASVLFANEQSAYALSSTSPKHTAKPANRSHAYKVINADPDAATPDGALDLARLLNSAAEHGLAYGLDVISTQYYAYTTSGVWLAEVGIGGGIMDPTTPVLVVSLQGSGIWLGAGASYVSEPTPIDGITFAYDAVTGMPLGSASSYIALPLRPVNTYEYITDYPTLEPRPEDERLPGTVLSQNAPDGQFRRSLR